MSEEYMVEFNEGDAFLVTLDYTINDIPVEELSLDEIEFSIGNHKFLLSAGDIYIDSDTGKYVLLITQESTMELFGIAEWMVRFRLGDEVVSDDVQDIKVGRGLSSEVI